LQPARHFIAIRVGPFIIFEKKAQTDEQLLDTFSGGVVTSSGVSVSC
jgi:hypothetical protein